ncbi:MAG: CinY protein [Actinomycetota bacterium]|nr:CinY protein [Actinomycetota bacterium]
MRTPRSLVVLSLATAILVASATASVHPAFGFGTINAFGQRSEHERITRAALACPAGIPSDGSCFEPKSIDQLAGKTGTFGAVGSPDSDEIFNSAAHCDDADFLNAPGYPRTRAQATAQLQACVNHLRMRFDQGRTAAAALLEPDGTLEGDQVDLTTDCTFTGGFAGRAKCNTIEGFGRALHGIQDFYSHSNWADTAGRGPITIDNPPGLNLPAPSPILDLRVTAAISVPLDLTTGFFKTTLGIPRDNCPATNERITHACLNKDNALIDPTSGAVTDPTTPRGRVGTNAQKAVTGAIIETRRQWADFRAALITTYGAERGKRMISALTQDVP